MTSKPITFRFAGFLFFILALASRSHAEPFTPRDGSQILEHLRNTPFDPEVRRLRDLRSRLSADTNNLALAVEFARLSIERGRAQADPRCLGHAESALAPWWNLPQPPLEALVLRATIKQSRHDFAAALADLNLAVHANPGNAQAWLTRSTVLCVLGRYSEARQSCIPLLRSASELIAVTAAANIASLNGDGERSCVLLQQTLDKNPTAPKSERLWALTLMAETSARLGKFAAADELYLKALSLDREDAYLLAAYADFLLDQKRFPEVINLLKDQTRVDNLLLRLAQAESGASVSSELSSHLSTLQARFEACRIRGDVAHQREEARFTLHLLHRPLEALRLAQANWQVQHEPADVRILLETALAAGTAAAAQPALDFIRENRLEDIQIKTLSQQFTTAIAR